MIFCREFSFVLAALLLPSSAWGGFVDMDTPLDKRTTKSLVDNTVYHLVCFLAEKRSNDGQNLNFNVAYDCPNIFHFSVF